MDTEMHKKPKGIWQKFWHLFWKDDSWKGWVFSLIILFVFIKLIFFPGLRLITGTELPLAIVDSCSMYHKGFLNSYGFEDWWQDHEEKYSELEIKEDEFKEFKLKNGFNKGDILFITGANPEKLEIGDIIIFNGGQKNPIIHRIIDINEDSTGKRTFSTIGDNNNGQLTVEQKITEEQIVGKASLKIAPFLGWGRLIFYELQRTPSERGFCNQN